jgi:hypothetical protein
MAQAARRYDIYLPLIDYVGRHFPDALIDEVEGRLVDRFGGLTSQQRQFPLRGILQGSSRLYLDQVVVMTVLDFRRNGSARFIAQHKQVLLQQLEQEDIPITEQALRVH